MEFEDILGLLVILSLFVFPAMALSARLALKPMVEALLRLREGLGLPVGADEQRVSRLEARIVELQSEVARLNAVESFYSQLEPQEVSGDPAAHHRDTGSPP